MFPFFNHNVLTFKTKLSSYFSANYYKKRFAQCGKNVHLNYPMTIKNPSNILIGNDFNCGCNLRMETWETNGQKPVLKIGNSVSIMDNFQISCSNKITIGNGVLIGAYTFICDNSHGDINNLRLDINPANRDIYSKGQILIGDNVWIGRNVVILANVTIGNNSIIGANSVVTKSIPSNEVWAGNPAKKIKSILYNIS